MAELENTEEELVSNTPSKTVCPEHGKEVELYCETCQETICCRCAIKGYKHHNHDYLELDAAYEKYVEMRLADVNNASAEFKMHREEISEQGKDIEAKINSTFERLSEILGVRKDELISKLHQITQDKLQDLEEQKNKQETTQAELSSLLEHVSGNLDTDVAGALKTKADILKRAKKLSTPFQQQMLKCRPKADMIFSAPADMMAECQNYGQVSMRSLPDLSKCCIPACKDFVVAELGIRQALVLQAINYEDELYEKPIESLECELVSTLTGTKVRTDIKRKGQSQYEISYQPTVKERHQLHIKIEKKHIKGSPFYVEARLPLKKLGAPIQIIAGVNKPWGVAINQRGQVVVTERGKHCVSVFSPSGELLQSFGTRGSDCGQFNRPDGVAVDGVGNILVVDCDNQNIQKFTAEGDFLTASRPQQFNRPTDIAVNVTNSQLYVVDGNHRVQVFNSDLTFSSTFGENGSKEKQFSTPWGIACDSTGKVYVADTFNHRIQVFTAEGKFLLMFGTHGKGGGELDHPVGIAADVEGVIYVSERDNHRISVFTSDGQFVKSFGREGKELGEFDLPRGLAVGYSRSVYVCDHDNERVQVF